MIFQLIVAVVSAVFTYAKQRKMQKRMEAEADARKGFKVTTKGEPAPLPIPYGRNKLGAVLTAVRTNSSYIAPTQINSDAKTWRWGGDEGLNSDIIFDKAGQRRNQFLTAQYAICQGGIESIKHVEVDDQDWNSKELRFGQRIHTHTDGGEADFLATANGLPATNTFVDTAYATAAFHLDRDDPQYYNIPNMAFYVWGMKIPNIGRSGTPGNYTYTYDRNGTKEYSNNSALVLLDYLTADYGMGLSNDDVNLESFYNAAVLCSSSVNTALGMGPVTRQGKIWGGVNPTTSGQTANYLGGLDVRTNAGESNLILSASGYDGVDVEAFMTDAQNSTGMFADTNTSGVRFSLGGGNTTYFMEDSSASSWTFNPTDSSIRVPLADVTPENGSPAITTATEFLPEEASMLMVDIKYPVGTVPLYECNVTLDPSNPIRDNVDEILLSMGNADLIWSEGKYKLQLEYPATQLELRTMAENTLIITDDILRTSQIKISYPKATERLNQCTIRYNNEQEDFASATATWPETDSAVHTALLAEDNGVVLNASMTMGAITDPYHAMARAEQFVRESRRSVIYEFEIFAEGYALEPGDYIKLNSELNDLTHEDDTALVVGVALTENMTMKIEAVRTHADDLAWNIEDTELSPYPQVTSFKNYPPEINNAAIAELDLTDDSVTGYYVDTEKQRVFLRWDGDVFGSQVDKYLIEVRENASTDDNQWVTVGETANEIIYHIPGNPQLNLYYRIKSVSQTGKRSTASTIVGPVNVAGISLKGDEGTAGVKGDLGPQGVKGTTGNKGITGAQGTPGAKGAPGDKGLKGIQGAQGETGAQGAKGSTGSKGITGLQGLQGDQGAKGSTGLQGAKGSTGSKGITGLQGSKVTKVLKVPLALKVSLVSKAYKGLKVLRC